MRLGGCNPRFEPRLSVNFSPPKDHHPNTRLTLFLWVWWSATALWRTGTVVKSNSNPSPETPASKCACWSDTLRNRDDGGDGSEHRQVLALGMLSTDYG
jgi:hypothetical protein